jgi:hypothetical protein
MRVLSAADFGAASFSACPMVLKPSIRKDEKSGNEI